MGKLIDILGMKFGRLTVMEYVEKDRWRCLCDCGNETVSRSTDLRNGRAKSCSCWQKEVVSKRSKTHGLSKNKPSEYASWQGMKARCYNPNDPDYSSYGGRGIRVSESWMRSFEKFYEDMGKKPTSSHSLDRIDTNGDYCKENCRWATPKQQANNTRRNIFFEINGDRHTISEWSELLSMPVQTLLSRFRNNTKKEDMLSNGNLGNVYFTYLGQTMTSGEWRSRLNIGNRTFYRKRKIMSVEEIIQSHLKEEYRNIIF